MLLSVYKLPGLTIGEVGRADTITPYVYKIYFLTGPWESKMSPDEVCMGIVLYLPLGSVSNELTPRQS